MQINVNSQFKYASVWLTKEEQNNPDVIEALKPVIEEYKKIKYRFVIFNSGNDELLGLTKALLEHNKKLEKNVNKKKSS